MACCLYFFQCSRTWLALLVPISAVFARLSSGHGAFLIPITFISLSTILLFTFSKRKSSMLSNSLIKETAENEPLSSQEKHQPALQGNSSTISADCSFLDSAVAADPSDGLETDTCRNEEEEEQEASMASLSRDLYSESESMDHFSSTSSEDHSSDIEQRLDFSDGSISDEESLIEIEIPSGHFVSAKKDLRWNFKCCKLSQDFCHQQFHKDFWAEINEFNEEDNLIEIDINMGSIKC